VAAVDYGYPWDQTIARFKFHGDTAWAHLFGALMAQAPGAGELLARCDNVIPMPLTRRRLGERGYNQAWLLARALTSRHREWKQKPQPEWLIKLRDTPPQHELDRHSRLTNLEATFTVSLRALPELKQRKVLLIDDIMTTGATLTAAARALTMAGVAQVDALVFARTPRT
jgi:ComF family protein